MQAEEDAPNTSDSPQEPETNHVIFDPELRRMLERGTQVGDFTAAIREAFVLLERRIRESAGLEEFLHGKDLIDRAFHPDTGTLQPASPVKAEQWGLYYLLLGTFQYYRNPIAHRPIYHTPDSAFQIVALIDHALRLVREAVERSLDLSDVVGAHEGQILRRRDYRLDIDGDGEVEVVILLELGKVMQANELAPHFLPVILKKIEKGYRRIPTEWIKGQSIYGPVRVALRYVTSTTDADIEVSWTVGNSQAIVFILRRQDDRYTIAKREIPPGTKNPYSGPAEKGFLVHPRQMLNFVDVDGDGFEEAIQTLAFDPDDLEAMGYSQHSGDVGEVGLVTRVWKWNGPKEVIVLEESRLVMHNFNQPSHFPS